jgi:hypothetical protein
LDRPQFAKGWDCLPTIFTFSAWQPTNRGQPRRLFDMAEARQIYIWLNSDLSDALPTGCDDGVRQLARQFVHIGQPVALANPHGQLAGGFRIDREIEDALTVLAKVSLIARYFDHIQAINPPPRFQ